MITPLLCFLVVPNDNRSKNDQKKYTHVFKQVFHKINQSKEQKREKQENESHLKEQENLVLQSEVHNISEVTKLSYY